MATIKHTPVSKDWHKLETPDGVFFGYSYEQVVERADAAWRERIVRDAFRAGRLPLTDRQRSAACRILTREICEQRLLRRAAQV